MIWILLHAVRLLSRVFIVKGGQEFVLEVSR